MKYLKKFFEVNKYKWITTTEKDQQFIDDIVFIITQAEDFGYETSYWLNEYRTDKDRNEPISVLEVEFSKNGKIPKEDYKEIIMIMERLDDFLSQTNFEVKLIQLFDFSKISTGQEHFSSIESIDTELSNINIYFITIKKK